MKSILKFVALAGPWLVVGGVFVYAFWINGSPPSEVREVLEWVIKIAAALCLFEVLWFEQRVRKYCEQKAKVAR